MLNLPSLALRQPAALSKSQQAVQLLRQLYRETSCLFDETARYQIKRRIRDRFRECKNEKDEQRRTKLLKDGRRILSTLVRANMGDKWRQVYILQHAYGQKGRRKHELLKPLLDEAIPELPLIPQVRRSAPPPTSPRLLALMKAQVGKTIKLVEPVVPEKTISGKPFPVVRIANMKWRHRSSVLERISPPMDLVDYERTEMIVMGYWKTVPPKRKFVTRDTKLGPRKFKPHVYSSRRQRRILRYVLEQLPVLEAAATPNGPKWMAHYSPILTSSLIAEGDPEDFEGVDELGDPIGCRINPNQKLRGHAAMNRKRVVKKATALSEWMERKKAEGKIPGDPA